MCVWRVDILRGPVDGVGRRRGDVAARQERIWENV